jgi:hypothetical protein
MKRLVCALLLSAALVHGYGPCQSTSRGQDWTGWTNNYQVRAWVDPRCNVHEYVRAYNNNLIRPNYPVDNATLARRDADKGRYAATSWLGCVWDGVVGSGVSNIDHCKKNGVTQWLAAHDNNCTNILDRWYGDYRFSETQIDAALNGHWWLQKQNLIWDGNWTAYGGSRINVALTPGKQFRANIGDTGDIIPTGISKALGSGTVVRVTAFGKDNNATAQWPYDSNYKYQQYATVFGGYSSSGEPWRIGQDRSQFDSGKTLYAKPYGDTAWKLMGHYYEDNNDSTIFNFRTSDNASILSLGFDNLVNPRVDFADLLQPHIYDSGAGSGNLNGRVPELGGAWTVHSGAASILSNKIRFSSPGRSTLDGFQSQYSYEVRITFPSTDSGPCGLIWGGAPPNDYWQLILDPTDNSTKIYEVRGELPVMRHTASLAITSGGEYRVQVIEETASPYHQVSINGALKNYYTTQGTPTGTRLGIFDEGVGIDACRFSYVAMRPVRSKAYDNAFGGYFSR